MWIVTDDETGAIVAGPAEEAPAPGEGETLREVPLNTRWNVSRRVFEDGTRWITKFAYVQLWPKPAVAAVINSTNPDMAAAWASFLTWDGPINLDDPDVMAGIDLATALEILTPAQAARIKDGEPPL